MKFFILPYKMASQSAKLLANALGCKRLKENGTYKYKNNHLIINWGSPRKPHFAVNGIKVLNDWDKIAISSNKISSLKKMQENGIACPEFTENIETAKAWSRDGFFVMCRTLLHSHSGNGIVVAKTENEIVPAPLYTKYFKRKSEYRVTIFQGNIIDICEKRRKIDFEGEINNYVRSNRFGFAFCYENVNCPQIVKDEALKAIKIFGLDFSSLDLAYNEKKNKAIVFELNSSAGFSSADSPLLAKYVEAFKNYLNPHVPDFNI